MKFKLLGVEELANKEIIPTKIRYWYDRQTQNWITQVLDQFDSEIENSYSGNKEDRDFDIEYFKNKYSIEDIVKY